MAEGRLRWGCQSGGKAGAEGSGLFMFGWGGGGWPKSCSSLKVVSEAPSGCKWTCLKTVRLMNPSSEEVSVPERKLGAPYSLGIGCYSREGDT